MLHNWEFQLPTRVVFGRGGRRKLGSLAGEFGRSVLLVGYRDRTGLEEAYRRAEDVLRGEGLGVTTFFEVAPEPTAESIIAGARVAVEASAEVIVALGGGSVIDAAKGIAALARLGGTLWDYAQVNPQSRPITTALPVVAMPTTAGTGSEVTAVAVFTHHVSPGGHADSTVSPVAHADSTVSPVAHADSTVSPVAHADSTVSPVAHADSTVSPVAHADSTVSPVAHADSTVSPVAHADSTVSPGGHAGLEREPPWKLTILGPALYPKVALIDPDLALGSPPQVTAACGADALAHAIEACLSRRANPFSSALAGRAAALILGNLGRAVDEPAEPGPREALALAAALAGAAFNEAGVVVNHAIAHALGSVGHPTRSGGGHRHTAPAPLQRLSSRRTAGRIGRLLRSVRR